MVKTKIIETTEKYDKDGKLVEKITKEQITENNEAAPTILPVTLNWGKIAPVPCCGEKRELSVTWVMGTS